MRIGVRYGARKILFLQRVLVTLPTHLQPDQGEILICTTSTRVGDGDSSQVELPAKAVRRQPRGFPPMLLGMGRPL